MLGLRTSDDARKASRCEHALRLRTVVSALTERFLSDTTPLLQKGGFESGGLNFLVGEHAHCSTTTITPKNILGALPFIPTLGKPKRRRTFVFRRYRLFQFDEHSSGGIAVGHDWSGRLPTAASERSISSVHVTAQYVTPHARTVPQVSTSISLGTNKAYLPGQTTTSIQWWARVKAGLRLRRVILFIVQGHSRYYYRSLITRRRVLGDLRETIIMQDFVYISAILHLALPTVQYVLNKCIHR